MPGLDTAYAERIAHACNKAVVKVRRGERKMRDATTLYSVGSRAVNVTCSDPPEPN